MAIKDSVKNKFQLLKQTFNEFLEDKCPRLGAALAYYTIFSIAPLLIIVTGIAGIFLGSQEETRLKVTDAINHMATPQAGEALAGVFKPGDKHHGIIATVVGVVTLLFGAAGVFTELQDSLNTIWGVTPKPGRGILGMLRDRFLSFTMVGGVLFLLLVSLVVTTALEAMGNWLTAHSGHSMKYVWMAVNLAVSYGVVTLMFAMVYKILPDVKMAWKDVWGGAAVTAVLFIVGKLALGLYLGHASVGSVYGAAGSLLVLLTWIYYSAQIFLLGAEFVQVWVKERGESFVPDENAIPLTRSARAAQGIPTAADLQTAAVRSGKTVTDEQMADELECFDLKARAEKRAAPAGKFLPMTLGFAVGFVSGRLMGKKPSRLVLQGPLRLVRRPAKMPSPPSNEWGDVIKRFKSGWKTGVDE